ncbi:MAG: divergent PAP2 family protein [Clostridia bacterium]|nr:divergent PAP2 family protein [Clostridia bacterium]
MDIFKNFPLLSAVAGWMIAELFKMIINTIKSRSLKCINLKALFASGGMPSSHSATMAALTTSIGLSESAGLASPLFALSCVLSYVVMYDAAGVRHETGKQGKALNRLLQDVFNSDVEYANEAFKELVGHTKMQVFVGGVLGIAVGFAMHFICL